MSKIDELIQQYCPKEVPFKRVQEIAQVSTGSSNGNEAEEDGQYPFFIRSQTIKRKKDWEYDEEAIIIPGEGGIGEIYHYVKGKYALHQRVYRIHFIWNDVNVKFAFHYFRACFYSFITKKAVSATVKSIRKPMIEEFSIPIPPKEVQEEIVRILDKFTELTAELTARQKQYEYYRDQLLTFGDDVEWKTLGEVAEIGTGSHDTQDAIEDGRYIFYARGREPLSLNTFDFDEVAIIPPVMALELARFFIMLKGNTLCTSVLIALFQTKV